MTAILMSLSSLALLVRVRAINDTNTNRQRAITLGLGALLAAQVAVHFVCCFFYHPLNLQNSHGCISAPKYNWVGIYWVVPTIFYLVTVSLYFSICASTSHKGQRSSCSDPVKHLILTGCSFS